MPSESTVSMKMNISYALLGYEASFVELDMEALLLSCERRRCALTQGSTQEPLGIFTLASRLARLSPRMRR